MHVDMFRDAVCKIDYIALDVERILAVVMNAS
jgi:hypothetical protein